MPSTISTDTSTGDELSAHVDELWSQLRPIIAGERYALTERCHQLGLSMLHLHLMSLLEAKGPIPMSRIAELLGVALPNATGLVSRMQERDVVDRLRDENDRRVVLVRLTTAGRATLRDLEDVRRRRLALALAQLTTPQRNALLRSIHTLRAAFETAGAKETTA
ncbi:MAG TPA: MarR family transcriptional regulator [Candidatus Limnocylindria bacterium]|nr:MarR family transcriptional regulator [Candidatus Limnocylindria bacterium]